MKVYVLTSRYESEQETSIVGIYSTLEVAEREKALATLHYNPDPEEEKVIVELREYEVAKDWRR